MDKSEGSCGWGLVRDEVRDLDLVRRIPGSPEQVLSRGPFHLGMGVISLAPQWRVQEGDAGWEAGLR